MNIKSESRKLGRFLRKHARLTLPESVKVAKWFLRSEFGEPPSPATTREYLRSCGCCWETEVFLPGKNCAEVGLNLVAEAYYQARYPESFAS